MARWLEKCGDARMHEGYVKYTGRRKDFLALLLKHRSALEATYAAKIPDRVKRREKARIFSELKDEYQVLKAGWGGYAGYDRWFAEPLSNAHLASVAAYNDLLPGFRALLAQEKRFSGFYTAVQALARLDQEQRQRLLRQLAPPESTPLPTPVPNATAAAPPI